MMADSMQPTSFILQSIDLQDLEIDGSAEKFHDRKSREGSANFLGGGSFGDVYKAHHKVYRTVAVKIAHSSKRNLAVMYQKERGNQAQALTSEEIVSIKGSVKCTDEQCKCGLIGIVMEYMERGSLWNFRKDEWEDKPDDVKWPLTNRMVDEIANGMYFLHEQGIIHRDLKLENVLINKHLKVKVADLGLATNQQSSTRNKCWGTDSHKPPEAFRTDPKNPKSVVTYAYDVYCFAITLYELLTGIQPFKDMKLLLLIELKVKERQTPYMGHVPSNTPQELVTIMESSWSYEPDDRPKFSDIVKDLYKLDRSPSYESLGCYFNETGVQESGDGKAGGEDFGEDFADAVPTSAPKELAGPSVATDKEQSGGTNDVMEPNVTTGFSSKSRPKGDSQPSEKKTSGNDELLPDLMLHETADKIAGSCDLRAIALRLKLRENEVARIETQNPTLVMQFYRVFQLFFKQTVGEKEMFHQLIEVLKDAGEASVANWLRKEIGLKEPVASIEGEASSSVSDNIPPTEAAGRNQKKEFYDIFLMCSSQHEKQKFCEIAKRQKWSIRTSESIELGVPFHAEIERILRTSTHLAVILSESDCINCHKDETSMAIEMAFQLAYSKGNLASKVIPIRSCNKRSLPLYLQALTGAHIDDESFEERLVQTIDTSIRVDRMNGVQE